MAANYWIKLYHEILDDPKMATLPDRLWRRTIELFLCAGRLGKTGQLPPTNQLAWVLRTSTDELELDLRQIELTGIIKRNQDGWIVCQFAKRQAAVSDAERQRQHRDRSQKNQYYGSEDVTNASRNVMEINRLTDTDTEADTEAADNNDTPPSGGDYGDDTAGDPPFRKLLDTFCNASGLSELVMVAHKWIPEIDLWQRMDATPEDIERAVTILRDKRYSINSPKSITNTLNGVIAERKTPAAKPAKIGTYLGL